MGRYCIDLACDGLATVQSLVPAGVDPHAFELSLTARASLEDADLFIANGLGLEGSLQGSIDNLKIPVLQIASELEEEDLIEADAAAKDPHICFDPHLLEQVRPAVAETLVEVGVEPMAAQRCLPNYQAEFRSLDDEIAALSGGIASQNRKLVTNYDAMGYFAVRYDFEVVGTVLPTNSTLAEANPADLPRLAQRIEEQDVPAIFVERGASTEQADRLEKSAGDVEVVILDVGSLSEPGTPGDNYLGYMRHNAGRIVDALS